MARSKAITLAAERAGAVASRFAAVEQEAQRVFTNNESQKLVRAFMNGKGGLHALIVDEHGTTLEIKDGAVAVSVNSKTD